MYMRSGGERKAVQKPVKIVGELWIKNTRVLFLLDIHKVHRRTQLLNTLSSEVKSRVISVLVVLRSAILRQACSTVV